MKVVVTGSTGLVGQALQKRLLQDGHEFVGLSRSLWEGESQIAPPKILRGCDAIVHLAGENIAAKRWTRERKQHLILSRVQSARNLKAGLDQAGVSLKTFISASAVGIFGDRGDEELSEASAPGDDFLARLCVEWEAAADALGAQRTVKARFGVVLSPGGGFLERVTPMFKRFGASRLGSGGQWFSWIHIHDLIEAMMLVLGDEKIHGPIHMTSPHAVTNSQLTQELKLGLHAFQGPPVPALALKLLYGELAQALLSSQRAIPHKLEQYGFEWKYPTLREALAEALRH